jgi:hypothetical protein
VAGVTISSLSTQYVLATVRSWQDGAPYNPTALTVQMAFTTPWYKPTVEQWNTAEWAWTTTGSGSYAAQCLVGPDGGVNLGIGTYLVWIQVTGSPEVPVASVGTLTIT